MAADFEAARTNNLSWMETATDTVYGPQWTHPHPSGSSDETKVAFSSDRGGVTQVYVAEADAELQRGQGDEREYRVVSGTIR